MAQNVFTFARIVSISCTRAHTLTIISELEASSTSTQAFQSPPIEELNQLGKLTSVVYVRFIDIQLNPCQADVLSSCKIV